MEFLHHGVGNSRLPKALKQGSIDLNTRTIIPCLKAMCANAPITPSIFRLFIRLCYIFYVYRVIYLLLYYSITVPISIKDNTYLFMLPYYLLYNKYVYFVNMLINLNVILLIL